jgi:hypothetical protein
MAKSVQKSEGKCNQWWLRAGFFCQQVPANMLVL